MTKSYALKDNQIQEVDDKEVDYEIVSPNAYFGTHVNTIPLQNAVQAPRSFYGARFVNQSMPLVGAEAPLVQTLMDEDKEGRSFDEYYGRFVGALRSDRSGKVLNVVDDEIEVEYDNEDGTKEKRKHSLYNRFPMNRKTLYHNTPLVKKGDHIDKGTLLAKSNFTDDKGTLAMGLNARVGLVPYKGFSMDDSVVISEGFAQRLKSSHAYNYHQDFDRDTKKGKNHFISLFPTEFTKKQIELLDDDGVVQPGTILKKGDPMILATRPRVISSSSSQLGKLSKTMRQARTKAAQTWQYDEPGQVVDVAKGKNGVKVIVSADKPTKIGDKITFRTGQKGIVSKILPQDQMPRSVEGGEMDVLLNPLGIPSRINNSLIYEILLGKIAAARGEGYKLPSFNKKGEKWYDFVKSELDKHGLTSTERAFDPTSNKELEEPVTIGNAFVQKLHHVGESKQSSRGLGSYDQDQQPLKGGSEGGKSKRLSGLEVGGMLSSGAYANLREGATLRGQQNDEYWRQLRQGYRPKNPGAPFVWKKFQTLMNGAGLRVKDVGEGRLRLGPYTDRDLDEQKAMEVKNGELVDLTTLEPIDGGLFDRSMVGANKWGKIKLPFAVPNPAFEDHIRKLLGLTKNEFRAVMAGKQHLTK